MTGDPATGRGTTETGGGLADLLGVDVQPVARDHARHVGVERLGVDRPEPGEERAPLPISWGGKLENSSFLRASGTLKQALDYC